MLVLTRKRFDKIRIGDDIVIKVIKTGRSAVKIGIEAPEDVRVVRAELCEDRKSASTLAGGDGHYSAVSLPCSDQFPHAV